jgi:hypothetical protein
VSLRWQSPQTDENGRKATTESENAKMLTSCGLGEKSPSLLGIREKRGKNPSLSANSFPQFFLSISRESQGLAFSQPFPLFRTEC